MTATRDSNYYRQCALFMAEAFGNEVGARRATLMSRQAFHEGDLNGHFHWKFVVDYLDGPLGRRVTSMDLDEASEDPGAHFFAG